MKTLEHFEKRIFQSRRKAKIKAFMRDPLRAIKDKLYSVFYWLRCYFFPFNVVKCEALPRTWSDKDWLMLHAMFQILVDFIELEQPFCEWENKPLTGRYTDRAAMHDFIERHYNSAIGMAAMYWPGITEEEKTEVDKRTNQQYHIYKEIMSLYEWYKDKKYEFDYNGLLTDKYTPDSLKEVVKLEIEHEAMIDSVLTRLLRIRRYLWT